MSTSPPTTLGKYQIIREIARSNDIVYEGWDPAMNRRVALKELSIPPGANQAQVEDRKKRFMREARAAGSLTHPNIVTIFEVSEDQGRHFIAMEYLDGRNLRNELDSSGLVPKDRACMIAGEVLKGLSFAHSRGVVHRDIKPENIQLLEGGAVKITDFGIARLTFEPNITMDGQVFGTPSYMSPEQINGKELDARTDLFSVGVILYEMLNGQKPFQGDNVMAISYAIMNKEPAMSASIAYPMVEVLEKALSKMPQFRYASAEDMRKAVERANEATAGTTQAWPGAAPPQPPSAPTVNPYLQPQPTASHGHMAGGGQPHGSPYQPGQIIQQPYNPYGHTPQTPGHAPMGGSPYGGSHIPGSGSAGWQAPAPYQPYQPTPGGAPPPAQPPGAPYQPIPYQLGTYVPYQPHTGSPIPVYYPPKPRPLFTVSAEARAFLIKLVVAVVLVVGLISLAIAIINRLGQSEGRTLPARQSAPPTPGVTATEAPQAAPPSSVLADPGQPSTVLATPSNPQGDVRTAPPPSGDAPANASALFAEAQGLARQAASEPVDDRRRNFWRQALTTFQQSIDAGGAQRERIREAAVIDFVSVAADLRNRGERMRARQALLTAKSLTGDNAQLMARVEAELQLTSAQNPEQDPGAWPGS